MTRNRRIFVVTSVFCVLLFCVFSVRAAEEGLVRHSAALAYFSKGTISASSAPSPVQSFRTQS